MARRRATGAVVFVSFLTSPADWFAWLAFLSGSSAHEFSYWLVPIPLIARLATAALVVVWGARTDRPWVVPIAVGSSIPVPYPTMVATMICALALFARSGSRSRSITGPFIWITALPCWAAVAADWVTLV